MTKSHKPINPIDYADTLRIYRAPWEGQALFACRKCQRRMKKRGGAPALAKLKKWFKKRGNRGKDVPMTVIEIPCVDLCPKEGVTVFWRRQLTQHPPGVCIARTE